MSREARQILMNPRGYTRTSITVAEQVIKLEDTLADLVADTIDKINGDFSGNVPVKIPIKLLQELREEHGL